MEISDPGTKGMVSYNVTFQHLMEYIRKHQIEGDASLAKIEMRYGLGGIFPMPGGLRENILWLLGEDAFVRQVEGEKKLYRYLQRNAGKLAKGETPFLMIDTLNCENGCLSGIAVDLGRLEEDDALACLLREKKEIKRHADIDAWKADVRPEKRLTSFMNQFAGLSLEDYKREYTDRSAGAVVKLPSEEEIDEVFLRMKKVTEESRKINCTACGNDNCRSMAIAIYHGFNHRRNCVHYLKNLVEEEQELLRYRAEYDQFLDIMNHRTIMEKLTKELKPTDVFSVLLADINGFKGINSTYGTAAGDAVLKQVAHRLKELCTRKGWMIARYGGDEFLIFVPDKRLKKEDAELGEIQQMITAPVPFEEEMITTTVSIGISASDGQTTPEQHMIAAESAMYLSKTSGKNTVLEFSEEQKRKAIEENMIKEKVRGALENDGFFMVYQPKVDAQTKKVSGYEALVRMKEPGMYPGQFIPIAEKNGWIWRIGRITTELTLRQLAKWREEGYILQPVSVNFSSNQLNDEGYVDFLEERLAYYDIPPEYIEIEITEGLFLDNTAQAKSLFERFQNLGIKLLMDDFGTGYSSLGYLTYIPVDVIKLDKSLVDTYLVDGKANFIKNVIYLMHDLDKEMVIEGVEEKWQYERLCEFGADTIQGYYFSKPIPAEEAIVFQVEDEEET